LDNITAAFHRTALLRRFEIFSDDLLTPRTALDDAHTPAPGWVGSKWKGGTLLVGINPGGGGDEYRRNPTDDLLYSLLRAFRDAASAAEQRARFEALSKEWIAIERSHRIWRIIGPILDATGETESEVAFMNILPFRTRMDKPAPIRAIEAAWARSAHAQVKALAPRRIIALGKKAWNTFNRFELPATSELILFKRGIGDSYIPAESQAVLAQLRSRQATLA
jgi:hypothetical protein